MISLWAWLTKPRTLFATIRFELHLTEPLAPGRHLLEWSNTADTQSGRVAYLKPVREKP